MQLTYLKTLLNKVKDDPHNTVKIQLHLETQISFMIDKDGNQKIDYIGKFENLEADFNHVCDVIRIKANLIHANAINRNTYQSYYNNELKQIVANKYKLDIETFRYKFE